MNSTARPGCLHGDFNRGSTVASFFDKKYQEMLTTIWKLQIKTDELEISKYSESYVKIRS